MISRENSSKLKKNQEYMDSEEMIDMSKGSNNNSRFVNNINQKQKV